MAIQDLCDLIAANNGVADFSFNGCCIKFVTPDSTALQASIKALDMNLKMVKAGVDRDGVRTVYVALPIDDLLSSAQSIEDQVAVLSLLMKLVFTNVYTTKPAPDLTNLKPCTVVNSKISVLGPVSLAAAPKTPAATSTS